MTSSLHPPDLDPPGRLRLRATAHPRIWAPAPLTAGMVILRSVLAEIRATVGSRPPESGGMLGGSRMDGVVRRFALDQAGSATGVTFGPSHDRLTTLLRGEWNPHGDQLLGFVHSHPVGSDRPSEQDIDYARRFLDRNPGMDEMLLPIVNSSAGGEEFGIIAYAVRRDGRLTGPSELAVVDDDLPAAAEHEAFDRVREAFDLDRMGRSRVVVVGAGGASQYVEDLCRAGIGEVVLVDPDVVTAPNIATQQAYLSDIGTPKVDALARRLVDISPIVVVATVALSTDDLTDADLERLATARLGGRPRPEMTVVGGFTDSFWAQARVARVALNLGLPAIAAQVYAQGRGAEVTFAMPGLTPACQRCALRSRYRAYLDRGYRNEGGSEGTPIFSTTRLNALKAMVTTALLHGGPTPTPAAVPSALRWRRLLERIGHRNLAMIRLDPDIGETLGVSTFAKALAGADSDRIVTDETVWLPQAPENLDTGVVRCPDCGGTGNLFDAVGTLPDARLLPAGAA